MSSFAHAIFGNRDGSHQLLESSLSGEETLLDALRFLVDRPAGHIGPEVIWSPYWGCGPVSNWWALWRGDEDRSAPRKNMVKSRAVIIPIEEIGTVENIDELLKCIDFDPTASLPINTDALIDALSRGLRPVVVPEISIAPSLLVTLWPRLWPALRRSIAIRTFFGSESLSSGNIPHVVVIPKELHLRWRSQNIVYCHCEQALEPETFRPSDKSSATMVALLQANWKKLPGEFTAFERLQRIVASLRLLKEGRGGFTDALLIVRTMESFTDGLELMQEDFRVLTSYLSDMSKAEITDIRAASLTKFTEVDEALSEVEQATSRWIQEKLPFESDADALWILEHQYGNEHVEWWLRAVRRGLANSFSNMTLDWAKAVWRWWTLNSEAVVWVEGFLPDEPSTEDALLKNFSNHVEKDLQAKLRVLCIEKDWVKLLAGVLRRTHPLKEAVNILRMAVSKPELGISVLLEKIRPEEIVALAAEFPWEPLIEKAAQETLANPDLLDQVDIEVVGLNQLLAAHLSVGGKLPPKMTENGFLFRLFDGCVAMEKMCLNVIVQLGTIPASAALVYPRQYALWNALGHSQGGPLVLATGTLWLERFAAGEQLDRPAGSAVTKVIRTEMRKIIRGGPIGWIIDLLELFPELPETEVTDWISENTFSWSDYDHERFGKILIQRRWSIAAKRFRWSGKSDLNVVAWHAQELLSFWDRPWYRPTIYEKFNSAEFQGSETLKMIKILFELSLRQSFPCPSDLCH